MKTATTFCAALIIAIGAQLLYANTKSEPIVPAPASETEAYLEDNKAWFGMFFCSENVVEEYEYDDAYCLLYDDVDANMFDVEICVDLETYQLVCQAIKDGRELIGTLVLNEDCSYDGVDVFTFMPEPEFEMAEASANIKKV